MSLKVTVIFQIFKNAIVHGRALLKYTTMVFQKLAFHKKSL